MPVRLFTVDEANGLVGRLDGILGRAQGLLADLRGTRDQLVDLRIIWGERVLGPDCPDHAEYERYRVAFADLERRLKDVTGEVSALGCELKDVENGLVDFYANRGEEVVFLCWRRGEPAVGYWHPLEGGFAARRPLGPS